MSITVAIVSFVVGAVAGWWGNSLLGKKVTAAEAAVKQAADEVKKA